jgi:hypothetical protein
MREAISQVEKRKKYKANWIPRAALVLLYLTMLSVWWLSGLSARFVTGAAVDDNARVALFHVTGSGTLSRSFAVVMKPGDSTDETITVSVQNSSETAVSYTIAFLLDGNLPITVTTKKTGTTGTAQEAGTAVATAETAEPATADTEAQAGTDALTQETGGKLVWHTAAALEGEQTTYTFQLAWDETDNGYQFSEGIESITVEITAMQED